jgi:hypothetical protein
VDDPYAGVGVAVNAALVPLGQTKRPLQIEVVTRQVEIVSAGE